MVCTVSKAESSWAKERSTQCCEIQRLERELQSRWALRTDSCRLARCVCPRRDQSGGVGSDLGECLRGGNCLDGYHSPLVYRRPQLDLWCRGAVIGRSLAEKMGVLEIDAQLACGEEQLVHARWEQGPTCRLDAAPSLPDHTGKGCGIQQNVCPHTNRDDLSGCASREKGHCLRHWRRIAVSPSG